MKKIVLVLSVLVLVFAGVAQGKVRIAGHSVSGGSYLGAKGLGLGIQGGWSGYSTTGLTLKTWLNADGAAQFDATWYYGWGIGVGAAYLIHNFDIIEADNNRFPLYFGIKGWAYFGSGAVIGVQVPLGIAWIPREFPIDVFFQIEPGITLVPGVGNGSGGAIGIRYWLN
jgi:hypothetical protein